MGIGIGGIVSLGGGTGGSSGAASGIQVINPGNNVGPTIDVQGVNGVQVTSPSSNVILIDGAGASGVTSGASKFAESFVSITSGTFTHNFGTLDVIVQIYDSNRRMILPDNILLENGEQVSVFFNREQSGRVVIV